MLSLSYGLAIVWLIRLSHCSPHFARETGSSSTAEYDAQGWTPKPTQSPVQRPFGVSEGEALFPRQLMSLSVTCGYLSGDASRPIGCTNSGETCCTYLGTEPRNWACCNNPADSAGVHMTGCLTNNGSYTGGLIIDLFSSHLICPSTRPNCITTALEYDGIEYQKYDCAVDNIYQVASTSPTTATSSSTTSTSATTTSATSSSSTPSATSSPSPGPNVGAIAGGTVGGVAVLALIAGGLGYLAWKKKKARKEPMLEISQHAGKS